MKRLVALAILLVTACTVGPNYQRPAVAVPETFSKATAPGPTDTELASWWGAFGDPELDALVDRTLAQNLDLEAAAARIREARARETVAGAAALPQVDAQGSVTHQRISENAIPIPPGAGGQQGGGAFGLPGSEFTTWRAGFDASWEIDLFGKTRRSVEAAKARTEAAIWNRRDLQVTAAAEVANAYLTLRTLQARIANAEANVASEQRSEQLVAARARGGLATGQDLAQQSSAMSAAAAAIPALQARAEAQIHAIAVLTDQAPETLDGELTTAKALPSPPAVPPGVPSELLRRRPDIRAAERQLAASTADIGVAVADLYPRFSLTAAPALVSTALSSLLAWGSRSFSLGAAVDWPLFAGGRTRGEIAVANARQQQALVAYRKSVLTALQDVEDALSRVDGDRGKLDNLKSAVSDAARAEQISDTRYRGGLVTYSDVLLARGRRLSLEEQMIDAQGALARDTASLFKALGGGWPELARGAGQ
ncbi:MAG TPA: efflux transporter outer membrane subunit [Croceibacterium sp.]|jgi:NodT family efflux transporter outer membrane factor (OMF) lipoprotein